MDEDAQTMLPTGWSPSSIGEITLPVQRVDPLHDSEREIEYIDISSIDNIRNVVEEAKRFLLREAPSRARQIVQRGDVLFATIRPYLRNIAAVPAKFDGQIASTGFSVLRPAHGIEPRFLFYKSTSRDFVNALSVQQYGVSYPAVTDDQVREQLILLPPYEEQLRIVIKIEELFSELDNGIENFQAALQKLKFYRKAILRSAFEGKLTYHWREQNNDKLDTADRLTAGIKSERDHLYQLQLDRWVSALGDWEKSGRRERRPVKPKKLRDVAPIDEGTLRDLPKLPVNWTWVKLGELTWSVKDGPHYSPKYQDQGIPFISGGNVRPEGVDFSTAKFISRELHQELCERCRPEPGDILYTKGGTTGIARVNTYEIEFNVWVHIAVLKITRSIEPFFLQHALNSPFCYSQAQRFTHGVGNQDLGLTRMVNIMLAVCGTEEQRAVVSEVESLVSEIDALEKTIAAELRKAESLRQSVLKKAFAGKLVPQDPRDEPASVLLHRIRIGKAEKDNAKRKFRRKDAA